MKYDLKEYKQLLSIPSVTAYGKKEPMTKAAGYIKKLFNQIGFKVFSRAIKGNEIILAEKMVSPARPTILFYNHYDVQPPEPLSEWVFPPFGGTVCGGKLYARGAEDNKGNFMARFTAVKLLGARLPINIKFIVDGAEEAGSPGLAEFIATYRHKLAADFCIWECGGRKDDGTPMILLGCKGICYAELAVQGAQEDLHSSKGAVVPNPAWRLAWALNTLKDKFERIRISGFYDNVRNPSADDMAALKPALFEGSPYLKKLGLKNFVLNLKGRVLLKKYYYQPALNINGLTAGYQGTGHKTVLPKAASAKIDFRLVPDQQPDEILRKLRRHLDREGFRDVKILSSHGYPPARTRLEDARPWLKALDEAAGRVYHKRLLVEPMMPASGPMYLFTRLMAKGGGHLPCFGIGIGYSGSRIHAPNEHIYLSDYERGIKYVTALIELLGRM
ncbi:MAG: M20/M25/M40 family metallo-hydrolase [Planctomycetes bacterium]|nr:M20/M25/M40 family metallo-hydrolase [Planctomycetota bacterium]